MMTRLWDLLCSLKLAIYLASAATLLLMGGSLLIPFDAPLFGPMDQMILGRWLSSLAEGSLDRTWWFYLASLLMILFGLNTLCCFIDWLWHIKARWRKSGEYLLHLGVVLVLVGYIWGNMAGWRHPGLQCREGELTPLPLWPGHYIRLDSFTPLFGDKPGPPLDMISELTLLAGEEEILRGKVQINHPILKGGLVITPVSFGRNPSGFTFSGPDRRPIVLKTGSILPLQGGGFLKVISFYPDTKLQPDGSIMYRSNELGSPGYQVTLQRADGSSWQGWYFLTRGLPPELRASRIDLRPLSPTYDTYSALTVNFDPGAPLAAVGGSLMTIGVTLALFSFYRKRARQDRPEV